MKTDISQFKDYEELCEFLSNPIIQKEIELQTNSTKKDAWYKFLKNSLEDYIDNINPENFELIYSKGTGLDINVQYVKH